MGKPNVARLPVCFSVNTQTFHLWCVTLPSRCLGVPLCSFGAATCTWQGGKRGVRSFHEQSPSSESPEGHWPHPDQPCRSSSALLEEPDLQPPLGQGHPARGGREWGTGAALVLAPCPRCSSATRSGVTLKFWMGDARHPVKMPYLLRPKRSCACCGLGHTAEEEA